VEYAGAGEPATLAVLQEFVPNTGDGWTHVVSTLAGRGAAIEQHPDPLLDHVGRLGAITGRLHAALASDDRDPDFRPEPIDRGDVERWSGEIGRELAAPELQAALAHGSLDEPGAGALARTLAGLDVLAGATVKTRVHGDYHLGQVLRTPDGFVIIDFEGEPARPLSERRRKQSPLRDVAGMLRSLDYAAHSVAFGRPEAERAAALAALGTWESRAREAFLAGYHDAVAESRVVLAPTPVPALRDACAPFELQKAAYEFRYERDNRPDWVAIPLAGIRRILGRGPATR
jgi:maltose alpha-D-glucosyltransferase/alpha-amylase